MKAPERQPKGRPYPPYLADTIRLVRRNMVAGSQAPWMIELAGRIPADAGVTAGKFVDREAFDLAKLEAIWRWNRSNIAYVSDGYDPMRREPSEVVRDCEIVYRARSGDCDCLTGFVGAMILATFPKVRGQPPVSVWLMYVDGVPVHVFPVARIASATSDSGVHNIIMDTAALPGTNFGDKPGSKLPPERVRFEEITTFFDENA